MGLGEQSAKQADVRFSMMLPPPRRNGVRWDKNFPVPLLPEFRSGGRFLISFLSYIIPKELLVSFLLLFSSSTLYVTNLNTSSFVLANDGLQTELRDGGITIMSCCEQRKPFSFMCACSSRTRSSHWTLKILGTTSRSMTWLFIVYWR